MLEARTVSALLYFLEYQSSPIRDILDINMIYETQEQIDHELKIVSEFNRRGSLVIDCIVYLNENLHKGSTDEEYQTIMYDCGKIYYGKENLRTFFSDMYYKFTERTNSGSRLGLLVEIFGVDNFMERLSSDVTLFDTSLTY